MDDAEIEDVIKRLQEVQNLHRVQGIGKVISCFAFLFCILVQFFYVLMWCFTVYCQRFKPVEDRFASFVNAMHTNGTHTDAGSTSVDTNGNGHAKSAEKFQYQRAYKLSLDLKDSLYVYTSE